MPSEPTAVPTEVITPSIIAIRGQRVILDQDLAQVYGTTTHRLNEQVKRTAQRFPEDFMFQLSDQEFANLRSQSAISNRGGRRYPPFALTEHGAVMAASVLNTPLAVEASIAVVRAFVHMRRLQEGGAPAKRLCSEIP